MPIEAKRQCLIAVRERYKKATKKEKKIILDEFCKTCGYKSRKHAIAILNGKAEPRTKKPGPKPIYDKQVEYHLVYLWRCLSHMCSKRLVAAIPHWLPKYKEPTLTEKTRKKLLEISPSTVDRILRKYRESPQKGISTTRGHPLLKHQIPIEYNHGKADRPGFTEGDTVAHCGASAAGDFAHTLTVTDICSGWTGNRAVWKKEAKRVTEKFEELEKEFPFLVTHLSTDNGNEFLAWVFVQYCRNRNGGPIKFSRKRPYKKNDAAHVEQKNFTHVRQLFGYARIDDPALVTIMNEIYRAYWGPLMNYYSPMMKVIKKERIGSRIKKIYDRPKTPCERLLESDHVSEVVKRQLRAQYDAINPFDLKERLEKRLNEFRKLLKLSQQNRLDDDPAA